MKFAPVSFKRAFSFTEIVMVALLLSLIFFPIMSLYQFATRNSMNAMASQEMIATGRKISSQIRNDLKNSCFPYQGSFSISFDDMLSVKTSSSKGLEGVEYSFFRFPSNNKTGLYQKREGAFYTQSLVKIVYRLEKSQEEPLLKLIRTEIFPGMPEKLTVLSDRINFFHIKKIQIRMKDGFHSGVFNLFFQLANPLSKIRQENIQPKEALHPMIIHEFYEVVGSDFFSLLAKFPESVRNWNTSLSFSDGK